MTAAFSRCFALTALALASGTTLGCGPSATPDDASVDAPPSVDAPVDAPRPDAPRIDAGFDPASLAPCTLDETEAFDATELVSFVAPEASAWETRLAMPLVLVDEALHGTEVEPDPELATITTARRARLDAAVDCAGEASCVATVLAFSDDEAQSAARAVVASVEVSELAARLRAAGSCARFEASAATEPDVDRAFIARCVADVLAQLGDALAGRVGELDATTRAGVVADVQAERDTLAFFGPLLEVTTRGLAAAGRDEAVRYEPLATENAAALARLRAVDFDAYPFGAIVVPGQGPTDAETALNPTGQARADLAYDRFVAGLAPVILVTGGHVHPDRTTFSEAIEMRRYLVETRGLDASAVLIDPYARHTTTNLRNAARMLVRAGVPTNEPLLVTSDRVQSIYIAADAVFGVRCDEELGYRPYTALQVLSDVDTCWLPSPLSFHVDARDPLDP